MSGSMWTNERGKAGRREWPLSKANDERQNISRLRSLKDSFDRRCLAKHSITICECLQFSSARNQWSLLPSNNIIDEDSTLINTANFESRNSSVARENATKYWDSQNCGNLHAAARQWAFFAFSRSRVLAFLPSNYTCQSVINTPCKRLRDTGCDPSQHFRGFRFWVVTTVETMSPSTGQLFLLSGRTGSADVRTKRSSCSVYEQTILLSRGIRRAAARNHRRLIKFYPGEETLNGCSRRGATQSTYKRPKQWTHREHRESVSSLTTNTHARL